MWMYCGIFLAVLTFWKLRQVFLEDTNVEKRINVNADEYFIDELHYVVIPRDLVVNNKYMIDIPVHRSWCEDCSLCESLAKHRFLHRHVVTFLGVDDTHQWAKSYIFKSDMDVYDMLNERIDVEAFNYFSSVCKSNYDVIDRWTFHILQDRFIIIGEAY